MIQWKQRLYAFLLRRVLGPLLDDASLAQLHESIDVSFQEGRFALTNVGLNTAYLTALCNKQQRQKGQKEQNQNGVRIRKARVDRLEIHLTLVEQQQQQQQYEQQHNEEDGQDDVTSNKSSFAWRAINLGYPSVSLLANIIIDGVYIEILPAQDDEDETSAASQPQQQQYEQPTTATEDTTSANAAGAVAAKTMLSSYIDAALSSLRLSVDVKSLCIRICSNSSSNNKTKSFESQASGGDTTIVERWMELQLKSASYHDMEFSSKQSVKGSNPACTYETVFHKALDLHTFTIVAGESIRSLEHSSTSPSSSTVSPIAHLDGLSQIRVRAVAYQTASEIKSTPNTITTIQKHHKNNGKMTLQPKIQQDIEINLSQRLHLSVDAKTLSLLLLVLQGFQQESSPKQHSSRTATSSRDTLSQVSPYQLLPTGTSSSSTQSQPLSSSAAIKYHDQHFHTTDKTTTTSTATTTTTTTYSEQDQADLKTIDGIMKQYQEARMLVQQNHFRGGILLPDESCCEGGTAFDAFFDANDASFARYSTILKESVVAAAAASSAPDASSDAGSIDFYHTKLRLHLREGSLKVAFVPELLVGDDSETKTMKASSTTRRRRADEYLLLTFSELSLTSDIAVKTSNHSLSIMQLEIEDSARNQQTTTNTATTTNPTPSSLSRNIEIGSFMKFAVNDEGESDLDDGVLIQAPCIAMTVKTNNSHHEYDQEIEINLQPIELTYRARTMENIAQFTKEMGTATASQQKKKSEGKDSLSSKDNAPQRKRQLYVSCPSVSITIPVEMETDSESLYRRCSYRRDASWSSKSSIDILMNQLTFQQVQKPSASDLTMIEFGQLVVSVTSPTDGGQIMRGYSRQFDILCLSGWTEVNPIIPVSIRVWTNLSKDSATNENHGKRTFPETPSISTFKARQDDEEEDSRIDRVLASKLDGVNVGSRSDLRGNDPQADMLAEASNSPMVVEISIPEAMCDLTVDEVLVIQKVLQNMSSSGNDDERPTPDIAGNSSSSSCPVMSLSVDCAFGTFALHNGLPEENDWADTSSDEKEFVSFLFHFSETKAHVVKKGSLIRQLRLLSHEVDMFEVSNLARIRTLTNPPALLEDRVDLYRVRTTKHPDSTAVALLYRSHLFRPISQKSPCLLIDIVNHDETMQKKKKNVYVTLYDTTYRCDVFSKWIQRFQHMLSQLTGSGKDGDTTAVKKEPSEIEPQLTRLFFSLSDCNIDYASSSRLKTSTRMIIRVGDLRVSANMPIPVPSVQTFSVALGEISVYLCKTRFPYSFENSCLLRSSIIINDDERDLAVAGLHRDVTCEEVQSAMCYLTVAMLSSFDAVIAISSLKSRPAAHPGLQANLTVGELGIFACKDSFSKFVSAISEVSAELTALDRAGLEALRAKSGKYPDPDVDAKEKDRNSDGNKNSYPIKAKISALEDLKRQSALRPAVGTAPAMNTDNDFLLDGYDWTAIDQDHSSAGSVPPPGEEQVARWFDMPERKDPLDIMGTFDDVTFRPVFEPPENSGPRIIHHHFPIQPVSDPLSDGDMGIPKYAGTKSDLRIKSRILVHDFSLKIRCFDGYDWPELLNDRERRASQKGAFLIDHRPDIKAEANAEVEKEKSLESEKRNRKSKLMDDLLGGGGGDDEPSNTFKGLLIPEERGAQLKEQAELRKLSRRPSKYFQISASNVCLRLDSLEESQEHRLQSCLNLRIGDLFLAETISLDRPVKFLGEWVNDVDHPRDSKDGLLMMKLVTWFPVARVTPNNEIVNDECEGVLKSLPLRCTLDQRAIRFVMAFFRGDGEEKIVVSVPGRYTFPPPLFRSFRVRPYKMKVDYIPEKLDAKALRDGSLVELINLSPIDGMVLTLQEVEANDVIGFGEVNSISCRAWLQEICSTQLFKFVTNCRPLEPITSVGTGASDLIILPWEAIKNGEDVKKALRAGASSFSNTIIYETIHVSSHASRFLADKVAGLTTGNNSSVLPSRPLSAPKHILDTKTHIMETMGRGLQHANYKIVIVPYREYRKSGVKGAATSVLKGIPVAIAAPTSATAEAISYALLGARNSLRPDLRQEEEASRRGLHTDY